MSMKCDPPLKCTVALMFTVWVRSSDRVVFGAWRAAQLAGRVDLRLDYRCRIILCRSQYAELGAMFPESAVGPLRTLFARSLTGLSAGWAAGLQCGRSSRSRRGHGAVHEFLAMAWSNAL